MWIVFRLRTRLVQQTQFADRSTLHTDRLSDIPLHDLDRVLAKNFTGDGACGKTCLLIVFSKGMFPEVSPGSG